MSEQETAIQQKLAAIFAANKDDISIPKIYVDMTNDIGAAAVLDEIMFWTLPKRGGKTGLRVFKDGRLWLAVRRADWWERKRLTARQADTAIEKLVKLDLVEKDIFLFDGKPTVHLRLKTQNFVRLYSEKLSASMKDLPEDEQAELLHDISDLYQMMGFPSQNREGNENVISISQNCKMLNLQNREIINIPLHPPTTSFAKEFERAEEKDELSDQPIGSNDQQVSPSAPKAKKRRVSLPAGSDIGFLLASGMSEEEIADYTKKANAEKELLAFFEEKMGYGTTLDWWGKNPDMRRLREFLLTKSREEIERFAKWCKRTYSKFRPEDVVRYPRNVITFWPMAFENEQPAKSKNGIALDDNGVPVTY